MDKDYINIRHLLSDIEELRTIDEDTGQLEAMLNGEDTYPITFPAALILFNDTDWTTLRGVGIQRGLGSFTIRLAFDCYDDTHIGAEQDNYAQQRQAVRLAIHRAIHDQVSSVTGSRYQRKHSRSYSLPGRIKVYEQEYSYSIEE